MPKHARTISAVILGAALLVGGAGAATAAPAAETVRPKIATTAAPTDGVQVRPKVAGTDGFRWESSTDGFRWESIGTDAHRWS